MTLIAACRRAGVQRLVHVGTEAALLKGQPLVAADERTPLAFDSTAPYAATKAEAEAAVIGANGDGLETVVVRPRFVWGAGDTTLLPVLTEMARTGQLRWIGGGRQLTSTTHVENTVEGLVLAAERGHPGNAYFVTDGSPVVFREFVSALIATQGVQAPEGTVPLPVARALAAAGEAAWRLLPLPGAPPRGPLRALGLRARVHDRRRQGARPARLRAGDHERARPHRAPGGVIAMDVAIGLPAAISGMEPRQLLEWARRAEARGFSSLGTLDRLVYPNYEPLLALAAAAAVTERIRLVTSILIAPIRASGPVLAKQVATLHHLSGGRVVLGVAVGGRKDDYEAAGVDFHRRGRQFDEMLDEFRRVWAGEDFGFAGGIGPEPPGGGPPVLIGGTADAAFRRAAAARRLGDGRRHARQLPRGRREAPRRLGVGRPRGRAPHHVAGLLRARRRRRGGCAALPRRLLRVPGRGRGGHGRLERRHRRRSGARPRGAFEAAGCDELVLFPCDADPAQVDLLADALGMG